MDSFCMTHTVNQSDLYKKANNLTQISMKIYNFYSKMDLLNP